MDFDGDSVGQKPLKSKEAVADGERIRKSLLYVFDYGMSFRRAIGKSGAQTYFSLGRDPKPKDKSKYIDPSHDFVKYLVTLQNGELDMDVLTAYTCSYSNSKPEVSVYDKTDIVYNGVRIETTIGRLIVNKVVFGQLWNNKYFHYINKPMNEKVITSEIKYVAQLMIEKKVSRDEVNINRIVDLYQELGLRLSTLYNSSITYEMLNPDEGFTEYRSSVINSEETQEAIANSDVLKYQDAENQVINYAKKYFQDNEMIELYESDNKAKWDNDFKNMVVSQGAIPKMEGGKPIIVSNPLNDGTPLEAIPATINTGMVGASDRAIKTALGGTAFKDMTNGNQSILGFDRDCGSTRGEVINTKNMYDILNRYVIENKKPVLITLDNVDKYLNKDIELRSPFYCKEKNGHYCSRCIGRTAFEMAGEPQINLGIYTTEAASGLMNLYMKSTHNLGTSTFKIKNLDEYLYPKPNRSLFYVDVDPVENIEKVYCNEDIEWRVPAAAVSKDGTEYKILAHGSIVTTDKGEDFAFVLGTMIPSSPAEVLNPDQKANDIDKHYIFRYYKGQAISNTTVTFREADTVFKMFNLFLQGNVSSLPPIEAHKMTLLNTFKTNKSITAAPITFDIILSTLARDADDLTKPVRETGNKNYKFVSCNDLSVMAGTFNALFGPDAVRGMAISAARSYEEQTGRPSPIEKALRM